MQTRFICHRELADITGMVRQLMIEIKLAPPQRFIECLIQSLDK